MELGVTYIPPHLPDHIDADMKNLKEIGCTEVLFAIQENHIYNLDGAIRFGAGLAKKNGLRPYAVIWGYANTFGGGRMSKILLENQELWVEDEIGNKKAEACYNNPTLVDKFIEFSEKLIHNGFEGIFVDEPTTQTCHCKYCREKYNNTFFQKLKYGENLQNGREFQLITIKDYVEKLCSRIKKVNEKTRTIVCMMPHDHAFWEVVAGIKSVDVFGTDPYWILWEQVCHIGKMSIEDAVKDTEDIKMLCDKNDKSSQVWLNCWSIPAGLEEDIYTGGKKLARVGCDSLYTWSYKGGLGTSQEECANPQKAWDNVVRLYRELSGKS